MYSMSMSVLVLLGPGRPHGERDTLLEVFILLVYISHPSEFTNLFLNF